MEPRVANTADLLGSITDLLWVALAAVALFVLRGVLRSNSRPLAKLGLGPAGLTMEFGAAKLDEASRRYGEQEQDRVGDVAKRSVIDRLQRNAGLVARARVLWADDHPENNLPIIELLRHYGASVDTPRSNAEALSLLQTGRYDVVISDVARDDEGPGALPGVELARAVFSRWGLQTILFTTRFDPTTLPGATDAERIALVRQLRDSVFAITTRFDQLLHFALDVLER
jgi:CheY-like chemotaxis protein